MGCSGVRASRWNGSLPWLLARGAGGRNAAQQADRAPADVLPLPQLPRTLHATTLRARLSAYVQVGNHRLVRPGQRRTPHRPHRPHRPHPLDPKAPSQGTEAYPELPSWLWEMGKMWVGALCDSEALGWRLAYPTKRGQ
jgi:hypothetical protein